MEMNEQKRVFLAILISGLLLASWQYFYPSPAPVRKEVSKDIERPQADPQEKSALAKHSGKNLSNSGDDEVKSFTLIKGHNQISLTSRLEVEDIKQPNAIDSFSDVTGSKNPFQIFQLENGLAAPLLLSEMEVEGPSFEGKFSDGTIVKGTLDDMGRLRMTFSSSLAKQYLLRWSTEAKELENNHQRIFSFLGEGLEQFDVDEADSETLGLNWAGLDFHYHLFAAVFPQKAPSMKVRGDGQGHLFVETQAAQKEFLVDLVYVKKDYDLLKEMGGKLHRAVDFGWWSIVAIPILWGLQTFYKWIPNYGIAIILLTLVIRFLLFPLNIKQIKGMRKMQEIQPQLSAIKEKYKGDPMAGHRESTALMKRTGANPMSGCLPLLLQMPIFFAFYKVLFNSVELVNSPFFGWIQDLSEKDPYYVLPILMGVSFFLQQKLMPTATADPTQKKIMMFMPLIFLIAMINLPAGLNLYFFVSNLFGIAQTQISKKYFS